MQWREYEPVNDAAAAHRVWREVGWITEGDEKRVDTLFSGSDVLVADLNGQPECLVARGRGTVRHLQTDLPFICIETVTTSHIARKRGLAGRLTAASIAAGVEDGGAVAGLGIFEQGYYNRLGFGNGSYDIRVSFDPADLTIEAEFGVPERLGLGDWEAVHASRLGCMRGHGACTLSALEATAAHMAYGGSTFGLGYRDFDGSITHHAWFEGRGENGPYTVRWLAYRDHDQLIELLALIKALGDQVRLIHMSEPPGIQLADLIRHPRRSELVTRGSEFQVRTQAIAWWQMRICDIEAALAATHLPAERQLRFALQMTDPIERYLPENSPWRGVGGDWIITLGPESSAERGTDASLPTLTASVNAFTRMWLGVRPATGLNVTDELCGPAELLGQLDEVLLLPKPMPNWGF